VMTGGGGWPMSVFMTPKLEPFFCGTYFPPRSMHGRPGFTDVCTQIARLWKTDRAKVLDNAEKLTDYLRSWSAAPKAGDETITVKMVARNTERIAQLFDRQQGGISGGGTNKFPPSMAMDLLLRAHRHTDNPLYREVVETTLEKMAYGGVYDQLGGGIHRYSTDVQWFLPHFEKMLYDQGLVSDIYLDAYQLTKRPLYARIAREIFDYCLADLQSPEGGFYSTRDADSEGREGKFYVWTLEEIREVLGADDAKLFAAYYAVEEDGNWQDATGHAPPGPINILHVTRPLSVVAKLHEVDEEVLAERLGVMRTKLLAVRGRRVPPGLDDKVLTSWNGLMIASLARGYRVLDDEKYRDAAVRAAEFVLTRLREDGRLLRSYRAGTAHLMAYLDDYANLIEALLNLYETTFDRRWLDEAAALNDVLIEHYFDEKDGAFFYTADDHEALLTRTKDPGDGATPSGNSVQAMNLLRLAILLDRKDLREKADSIFRAFHDTVKQGASMAERLLCAVDFAVSTPKEIAIVGRPQDPATQALVRSVYEQHLPNKVVALIDPASPEADALAKRIPLLAHKTMKDGKPAAYVCENYTCKAPVVDPEVLARLLQ